MDLTRTNVARETSWPTRFVFKLRIVGRVVYERRPTVASSCNSFGLVKLTCCRPGDMLAVVHLVRITPSPPLVWPLCFDCLFKTSTASTEVLNAKSASWDTWRSDTSGCLVFMFREGMFTLDEARQTVSYLNEMHGISSNKVRKDHDLLLSPSEEVHERQ